MKRSALRLNSVSVIPGHGKVSGGPYRVVAVTPGEMFRWSHMIMLGNSRGRPSGISAVWCRLWPDLEICLSRDPTTTYRRFRSPRRAGNSMISYSGLNNASSVHNDAARPGIDSVSSGVPVNDRPSCKASCTLTTATTVKEVFVEFDGQTFVALRREWAPGTPSKYTAPSHRDNLPHYLAFEFTSIEVYFGF